MAVAAKGFWPILSRPEGCVVVESKGEMVLDQIVSRYPNIKRIPILKLSSHLPQDLLIDLSLWHLSQSKHKIKHLKTSKIRKEWGQEEVFGCLVGDLLWWYRRRPCAIHIALLQNVGDGVVGHVDGGI